MILPAYTEMAKQSVAYVNKFGCPSEYVADMLRDIADALTSVHPQSVGDCSLLIQQPKILYANSLNKLSFYKVLNMKRVRKNIYSSRNVHNELFDIFLSKKSYKYFS